MIVGIDASNLGSGGARAHLWNLLQAARPELFGIRRIVVWGGRAILAPLVDRPWLSKHHVSELDASLPRRTIWQRTALPRLLKNECDILFAPGGTASDMFHPFVTMSQNMLPFEPSERARYGISPSRIKFALLKRAQASAFRRADGLIFLSEHAREVISRVVVLPRHVAVIPHGVENRFRKAPRAAEATTPTRILYVSTVDVYKHQWNVAEAVALLRERGLPLEVDFIGPAYPPALRRLRRTIARLDPSGSFLRYRSEVPYGDLHELLGAAGIFVFASSCENMPNTLVEAMAAGLAIASSDRGPMPEILGDAGLYFDPLKPSDIATSIQRLAEDTKLRFECGEAARLRALRWSWETCADQTLEFVAAVGHSARKSSGS